MKKRRTRRSCALFEVLEGIEPSRLLYRVEVPLFCSYGEDIALNYTVACSFFKHFSVIIDNGNESVESRSKRAKAS